MVDVLVYVAPAVLSVADLVLERVVDAVEVDATSDVVSRNLVDFTVPTVLIASPVVVTAAVDVAVVSYVVDVALVSGSVVVTIRSVVDSVVVAIEVDLRLVLVISGGPLTDVRGPEEVVSPMDVPTSVVGVVPEIDVD